MIGAWSVGMEIEVEGDFPFSLVNEGGGEQRGGLYLLYVLGYHRR